jgi:hypothetical protein
VYENSPCIYFLSIYGSSENIVFETSKKKIHQFSGQSGLFTEKKRFFNVKITVRQSLGELSLQPETFSF